MTTRAIGQTRLDGLFVFAIVYLVFIYLPVLFLPLFSFNDAIYVAFPLKGFTLKWYQQMVNNPGLLHALMNSVKIGASVPTCGASWPLSRLRSRSR